MAGQVTGAIVAVSYLEECLFQKLCVYVCVWMSLWFPGILGMRTSSCMDSCLIRNCVVHHQKTDVVQWYAWVRTQCMVWCGVCYANSIMPVIVLLNIVILFWSVAMYVCVEYSSFPFMV